MTQNDVPQDWRARWDVPLEWPGKVGDVEASLRAHLDYVPVLSTGALVLIDMDKKSLDTKIQAHKAADPERGQAIGERDARLVLRTGPDEPRRGKRLGFCGNQGRLCRVARFTFGKSRGQNPGAIPARREHFVAGQPKGAFEHPAQRLLIARTRARLEHRECRRTHGKPSLQTVLYSTDRTLLRKPGSLSNLAGAWSLAKGRPRCVFLGKKLA